MSYILNKKNQKIAYKSLKGSSPGIVFIHGLNSDMNGLKAITIEKYAKKNNLAFVRFDCRGHGKSFGKFHEFTISDWKEDLIQIIDNLTKGPQILIGSSMGGWLMLLASQARPKKISSLIGLAASADFGDELYNSLSKKNKQEITKKGLTNYSKKKFSYVLTKKFFIEAKKNKILNKKIRYKKPIILIHGLKDNIVKSDMPKKIINKITGSEGQIHYLKSSDHRLSTPSDLKLIINAINNIRSLI